MAEPPTLGVEEEYLLLDPETGRPVASAPRVKRLADNYRAFDADEVTAELLQVQVEIATPVCRTLDEVEGHLRRLRAETAAAAVATGSRIASVGSSPVPMRQPAPVTDTERYHAMWAKAPGLVDELTVGGMHVHVAVPSPDAGVAVLRRLRPWLPTLIALGANSPFWYGRDSGFASWRTLSWERWPVTGPPPLFDDAADYERRVQALVDAGVVIDRGQIYWEARLSENFPTVEIRATDAQLRVSESVLIAGLVRALVHTLLNENSQRDMPPELLRAAAWRAARDGLEGELLDLPSGVRRPSRELVGRLLRYVTPALRESGELQTVEHLLDKVLRDGNGAQRQREWARTKGVGALAPMLIEETAC